MAIEYTHQTITLDGVTSVTVSDIVPGTEDGTFARRILFYTEALNEENRRPDVELVLTSDNKASLEIATPTLRF